MLNTLQKDIVTLNRRYLLLVKRMAEQCHPLLPANLSPEVMTILKNMTFEEIDQIAEDMIVPCFQLNLGGSAFENMQKQQPGAHRKAYVANVLISRK